MVRDGPEYLLFRLTVYVKYFCKISLIVKDLSNITLYRKKVIFVLEESAAVYFEAKVRLSELNVFIILKLASGVPMVPGVQDLTMKPSTG